MLIIISLWKPLQNYAPFSIEIALYKQRGHSKKMKPPMMKISYSIMPFYLG